MSEVAHPAPSRPTDTTWSPGAVTDDGRFAASDATATCLPSGRVTDCKRPSASYPYDVTLLPCATDVSRPVVWS